MGQGASQVAVAVPHALPREPDIPAITAVPGGVLVPCSIEAPNKVNRNDVRVPFTPTQGARVIVRRIHLSLPVWLTEKELEKQESTDESNVKYKSEAEAIKAAEGLPENGTTNKTVPISPATAYEQTATQVENSRVVAQVFTKTKTKVNRSVLPVTVTVVARLNGPEGEVWSESFAVPLRYVQGNPGTTATGVGAIDAYADLVNGLELNPEQAYSLALLIQIPAAVKTDARIGLEVINGASVVGKGEVTFFYDVETTPVGK